MLGLSYNLSCMRLQILAIGFAILATACTQSASSNEVLVSAAISLKAPLQEIAALYSVHDPDTQIQFNFGASGLLAAQIRQGAPVDVFVSASISLLDELRELGRAGDPTVLVGNELVLLAARDGWTGTGWSELSRTDRIAIGNPKTVPAGRYAKQCLENQSLWDELQPRLVFAENARQVLDYVAGNDVGAGIAYRTDAGILPDDVRIVEPAPPDCHGPIRYGATIVTSTHHRELAEQFVALCRSGEARAVFERHGFAPLGDR